jgi:hypothetical protein
MYLVVDVIDVVDPVGSAEAFELEKPAKKTSLSIMDVMKAIFDLLLWLLMIIYLYHGLTLVGILN